MCHGVVNHRKGFRFQVVGERVSHPPSGSRRGGNLPAPSRLPGRVRTCIFRGGSGSARAPVPPFACERAERVIAPARACRGSDLANTGESEAGAWPASPTKQPCRPLCLWKNRRKAQARGRAQTHTNRTTYDAVTNRIGRAQGRTSSGLRSDTLVSCGRACCRRNAAKYATEGAKEEVETQPM